MIGVPEQSIPERAMHSLETEVSWVDVYSVRIRITRILFGEIWSVVLEGKHGPLLAFPAAGVFIIPIPPLLFWGFPPSKRRIIEAIYGKAVQLLHPRLSVELYADFQAGKKVQIGPCTFWIQRDHLHVHAPLCTGSVPASSILGYRFRDRKLQLIHYSERKKEKATDLAYLEGFANLWLCEWFLKKIAGETGRGRHQSDDVYESGDPYPLAELCRKGFDASFVGTLLWIGYFGVGFVLSQLLGADFNNLGWRSYALLFVGCIGVNLLHGVVFYSIAKLVMNSQKRTVKEKPYRKRLSVEHAMLKCTNCGGQLEADAKYCHNCGHKINK